MTHSAQRLQPPLGIAVMMVTLCACTPDRPPSATPPLSPTVQSTLREISERGAQGNGEQTFAYTLVDNCNLHATKLLNGQPIKQMVFSLGATQFERYDFANSLGYAVRTAGQPDGIDNVVFESHSLTLVESMLWLLEKIKSECIESSITR